MNRFEQLVVEIKDILGTESGLTSEDVDVDQLIRLMDVYPSNEKEWSQYAIGDETVGYTRNLVDEGNGNANLVSNPPYRVVTNLYPASC